MESQPDQAGIAGIILAAGGSSRFGSPKQLLPWGKSNLLNTGIEKAYLAGLSPVVVVLGSNSKLIQPTIINPKAQIVFNARWEEGQSTSMQAGLAQLDERTLGVIFILADQPQISVNLLQTIKEKGMQTESIVVPLMDGKRANPVYFPRRAFQALGRVTGDQGGRAIFSQFPVVLLEWLDDHMGEDIDSPEDYQRLRTWYGVD